MNDSHELIGGKPRIAQAEVAKMARNQDSRHATQQRACFRANLPERTTHSAQYGRNSHHTVLNGQGMGQEAENGAGGGCENGTKTGFTTCDSATRIVSDLLRQSAPLMQHNMGTIHTEPS